jgi:hypothetical protein
MVFFSFAAAISQRLLGAQDLYGYSFIQKHFCCKFSIDDSLSLLMTASQLEI